MTRTTLTSRVGTDGTLSLSVPLGIKEANREVIVTIEPQLQKQEDQSSYHAWLESIAGKWQGNVELLPQGDFEQRDSL